MKNENPQALSDGPCDKFDDHEKGCCVIGGSTYNDVTKRRCCELSMGRDFDWTPGPCKES